MLEVVPVSAFKDNYVWPVRAGTHAAVVDPGEARPVLDYLAREDLRLVAILATHHHPDHVGGIPELVQKARAAGSGPRDRAAPPAARTAPAALRPRRRHPPPPLTQPVSEGDRVAIPELGVTFEVLDIPGH